ncbi:Uncharacterised protein [Fusobacterium necrophorum subsp. necrophorum]|nr:Uncharacterised protein [Fusobacterium necrophorum subsp. necrophorum]
MEKRRLRKHLTGKSGAEVVKKLLEYQKKELEKQKRQIWKRQIIFGRRGYSSSKAL